MLRLSVRRIYTYYHSPDFSLFFSLGGIRMNLQVSWSIRCERSLTGQQNNKAARARLQPHVQPGKQNGGAVTRPNILNQTTWHKWNK